MVLTKIRVIAALMIVVPGSIKAQQRSIPSRLSTSACRHGTIISDGPTGETPRKPL